ncbi:hypothetical protein M9Y10_028616 [Tritrichomonas musculus]|uniref:non-specific serine/threonine protein kinase n=1 Tax=Tritrichomonas musculus TaxID=1915356 RepID=A0ABR2KLV4_9EUKA
MNRYEIIRELGKGSYGSVKLARDKESKELYAVKKVKLSCLSKSEREKALGEVKVLSSISHPNVVAYKESFQEKSSLFIVMEYIDGGDLDKVIQNQRNKLMEESDILRYFVQIVHVVNYLHTNHILHRDLKPQNVFLTKHGIVKLGDFGVAKSLDATCDLAKTIIGTPYYLSPEIWEGSPYDSKSDIWSLGCILFEMCSLHKPFEAQNATALLAMVIQGKHGAIPSRYSQNVRDLIDGMLNTAPQLRPTAKDISALPFIQKAMTDLYVKNKQILDEQRQKRNKANQKSEKKLEVPNRHLIAKSKSKLNQHPTAQSARKDKRQPNSLISIDSSDESSSPNRPKPSSRSTDSNSTKITVSKPPRSSRGKIPIKTNSNLRTSEIAPLTASPQSKKTRPRILFAQNESNKNEPNFIFMDNSNKSKSTPNIDQFTIDDSSEEKNGQHKQQSHIPRSSRSSKSAGRSKCRTRPDNFIIFMNSDDNDKEDNNFEINSENKRISKSSRSIKSADDSNKAMSTVPRWAASKPTSKRLQPTFGEQGLPISPASFNDDFISDDEDSDKDEKENQKIDKYDNDEKASDNEGNNNGDDDLFDDDFIDDNDIEDRNENKNKDDFNFEKMSINSNNIDDLDFINFSSSDDLHELEKANSALRDSLQTSPSGNIQKYTNGGNINSSRAKSAKLQIDEKENRSKTMPKWRSEDETSFKSLSCNGRILNIFDDKKKTFNEDDNMNTDDEDFKTGRSRDSIERIKSIRNKLENEIGDAQFALLYAHILTENTPLSAKFISDFKAKNENAVELVRDLIRLEQNP